MKLKDASFATLLRQTEQWRAVLLHGEDRGLVRARADALVLAVVGSLDDPFRVAEVGRDGLGQIPGEVASLALTGGRRAVRLREATDAATTAVAEALSIADGGMLVLEADALPARSRLRVLIEGATLAAALPCYREDARRLPQTIRDGLAVHRVAIDDEAVAWLALRLDGDRNVTRSELEKLALYAGPGGRIDLGAVREASGGSGDAETDALVYAVTAGDHAAVDRGLAVLLDEPGAAIGVLRTMLLHMQRAHRARAAIDAGRDPASAMAALRPPVFFKQRAAFERLLASWSSARLLRATERVAAAERNAKRTGAPAELLCREALQAVARQAFAETVSLTR